MRYVGTAARRHSPQGQIVRAALRMCRARFGARPARRLALAALLVAGTAAAAEAQKLQWTDVVYVPGRWVAGKLVSRPSANPQTDSLALVMQVDYFSAPPKWRAEIRRTSDGQTMGAPDVLIGQGNKAVVVTALGATPLEQHVLGQDPLVRAAVVFDANGRAAGQAGRMVERGQGGTVLRVVFRRSVRSASFSDAILDPGAKSGGRNLLASGISAVGDQRQSSVVATAGARGVDRVQTPAGSVPVTPDSAAIRRIDAFAVGAVALEDFMRTGGLGPYAVRSDSAGRRP
jgi:hypothetical protein